MTAISDKESVLERIGLFEGMSAANRKALADVCLSREVPKGQMLFMEGQKGLAIYILVAGSIQLYKTAPNGRKVVIKTVRQGEMFAEVVLFEQPAYPVNAIALRQSLVYMVSKHQLLCLLENPDFRGDFLASLMRKLRYLADQIKYLTSHDVEDRLLAFFLDHYGKKPSFTVTMSKKDIAAAIGTTPETLSRVLLRMGETGVLSWTGNEVRILC